ncbi:amidohydrolase family protein [Natranaerobius trueperi]|uniref:Amidohydrolase-related domain-containing protein n=1 Tax=Natranaerobius trueperi TaxID=759412 RepID=A0A226BWS7_9FIRM|nr:amidohydrolase family protein [Natranaerobius trueperi]OWZ83456.1 hypothetical protein CDO51_08695 [Natranaerobius trueperi]
MSSKPIMPNFPVIDFHIHLPVQRQKPKKTGSNNKVISDYRKKLQENFFRKWGFYKPDGKTYTPEAAGELWNRRREFYGLEKVNAVTAGFDNDILAHIINLYPDSFIGFTHHDIQEPNAFFELKRGIEELGLLGHKILAPYMEKPFDDPDLEPIWKYLNERKLPVLIHFGIVVRVD